MTNLGMLRRELATLRRRRALRRLVCGTAPLGTGCVCVLAAVFLLDFLLELDVMQRMVAVGVGLLMLGWILRRSAWPYLRERESELGAALQVERQHGIDDQLVAALQFEKPDADRRGSLQLESAVIARARDLSQDLDVFAGFKYRPMFRRAAAFLAVLVVAAGVIAVFPRSCQILPPAARWAVSAISDCDSRATGADQ